MANNSYSVKQTSSFITLVLVSVLTLQAMDSSIDHSPRLHRAHCYEDYKKVTIPAGRRITMLEQGINCMAVTRENIDNRVPRSLVQEFEKYYGFLEMLLKKYQQNIDEAICDEWLIKNAHHGINLAEKIEKYINPKKKEAYEVANLARSNRNL